METFSSSSGLKANNNKPAIYLAGVSDSVRSHAASTLDFAFESLPVKYLGMPLTSKRYTAADCVYLVEILTNRIRSWFARSLSYTARLQLVNSVLMSITNYWSQTVILPKRILNQINTACRSYLWHSETKSKFPWNVSWEKICRTKQEGGLGTRNLQHWNLVAVGKIAWHISSKKDSLWVKWVHEVYMKGARWELFNAPITTSWVITKLCRVKEKLNNWMKSPSYSIEVVYKEILGITDKVPLGRHSLGQSCHS